MLRSIRLRWYVDRQALPFLLIPLLIPPPEEGSLCEPTPVQGHQHKAHQQEYRIHIAPICRPDGPTPGREPQQYEQPRTDSGERDLEPRTSRRTVECFFHKSRQKDEAGEPRGYGENGAKRQD